MSSLPSRLYELHESKFPVVSLIELMLSKLALLFAHDNEISESHDDKTVTRRKQRQRWSFGVGNKEKRESYCPTVFSLR